MKDRMIRNSWKKPVTLLLTAAVLTNATPFTIFAANENKTAEEAVSADTAAAPAADPVAGTYKSGQKVTLKTTTKDAVIYYTLDGKEPTVKSAKFDNKKPIEIKKTTTLKAMAVAKDLKDSKISTFKYVIEGTVEEPAPEEKTEGAAKPAEQTAETPAEKEAEAKVAQPEEAAEESQQAEQQETEEPASSDTEKQTVPAAEEMTQAGEGGQQTAAAVDLQKAELSVDAELAVGGTFGDYLDPTKYTLKVYSKTEEELTPVELPEATEENKDSLPSVTNVVIMDGKNAVQDTDTIEAGKAYTVKVELASGTGYTFADNMPVTLNGAEVEADVKDGTDAQDGIKTAEAEITLTAPVVPVLEATQTPAGDIYANGTKVLVSAKDADASDVLQYKVGDAAEWTTVTAENNSITLEANASGKVTVTARVLRNGIASEETSQEYKVKPDAPTFAPASGATFEKEMSVEMKALEGGKIYYTTDGSDPTKEESKRAVYVDPSPISETTTVKAAVLTGEIYSDVAEATYTLKPVETQKTELIKEIKVLDIAKPMSGEKADRKVSSGNAGQYTVESIKWTKSLPNGVEVTENEAFEEGVTYVISVDLKANTEKGYQFDTSVFKPVTNFESKDRNKSVVINYTTSDNKTYKGTGFITASSKDKVTVVYAWKAEAKATPAPTAKPTSTPAGKKAAKYNNTITGLSTSYKKGTTISFTAKGATTGENDGDERYVPRTFAIKTPSGSTSTLSSNKDNEVSVKRSFSVSTVGTYTLTVTFQKQKYDAKNGEWKDASGTDTKTKSFKVTSVSSTTTTKKTVKATSTPKATTKTTTSKKASKNAKTGDETPVGALAGTVVLAGAAAVLLFLRKKKRQ